MVVGAAVQHRENGSVDFLGKFAFLAEYDSRARPAERLVGRGCYHVGVLKGVVGLLCSDQTGNVGHVCHQVRTNVVADFSEPFVVEVTWIRRKPCDDDLGLELLS